jgi:FtsP/CotA-like multicopper oxidase with cupredoxin domain
MKRREFLVALAAAPLTGVAAEPSSKAFALAIAKGRVDAAQETVRVRKGDKVELRWTSDRRIALHLHGYDLETTVTPEAPAVMSFQARIAGRFPVSEHGHGSRHERPLLYLEVLP